MWLRSLARMLIKMFQSAIDNDDEEKLKAFVGTLTLAEDDYYTKVKIRANNIIVSGGKLVQISCNKINLKQPGFCTTYSFKILVSEVAHLTCSPHIFSLNFFIVFIMIFTALAFLRVIYGLFFYEEEM